MTNDAYCKNMLDLSHWDIFRTRSTLTLRRVELTFTDPQDRFSVDAHRVSMSVLSSELRFPLVAPCGIKNLIDTPVYYCFSSLKPESESGSGLRTSGPQRHDPGLVFRWTSSGFLQLHTCFLKLSHNLMRITIWQNFLFFKTL